jgi:hypothetical protein
MPFSGPASTWASGGGRRYWYSKHPGRHLAQKRNLAAYSYSAHPYVLVLLFYFILYSIAPWNCELAWYRFVDGHSPPVHSNSPSKQRDEQCKTHLEALLVVRGGFCVTLIAPMLIQGCSRSCMNQDRRARLSHVRSVAEKSFVTIMSCLSTIFEPMKIAVASGPLTCQHND